MMKALDHIVRLQVEPCFQFLPSFLTGKDLFEGWTTRDILTMSLVEA